MNKLPQRILYHWISLCNSMNTLPNRKYLITHSTMQSLCLDNNERKETMNGYFLNTANSDIIQSPMAFKSTKEPFDSCAPAIEGFPFLSFNKQVSFVPRIYFNNWLGTILASNKVSQFLTHNSI